LAQLLINGSTTIRTDYIGGLIYRNDTLISIAHDEGIIKRKPDGSYKYQYFITDHLGNNRVVFEKLSDTVYVAQRADYYAFGGLMEGLSNVLNQDSWNFLFQGKEYVDAFGYNSYDFHARGYDANLGRFDGIDPVDNYMLSGYAGMNNNPISYIDPDGRNPIAIAFMVGMFASSINHMVKGTMPKNMWDFVKPGVIGAVSAGVGGAVLGAFSPFVTSGAGSLGSTVGAYAASGSASGFVAGGLNAAFDGENIGQGALMGAISGGVLGGAGGALEWGATHGYLGGLPLFAGDDPKYVKNTRPMVGGAGVIADGRVLPAPPSSIPWKSIMRGAGVVARTVAWYFTLAFTVTGDVPMKNIPRKDLYYHYTDDVGIDGIRNSLRILPNAKGKVYLTRSQLSPESAFRDLFLSQTTHAGRGNNVAIFELTSDQVAQLSKDPTQPFELIYPGTLKLRKGLYYAGKNYFTR
jgi:RHS repeat-associated protein